MKTLFGSFHVGSENSVFFADYHDNRMATAKTHSPLQIPQIIQLAAKGITSSSISFLLNIPLRTIQAYRQRNKCKIDSDKKQFSDEIQNRSVKDWNFTTFRHILSNDFLEHSGFRVKLNEAIKALPEGKSVVLEGTFPDKENGSDMGQRLLILYLPQSDDQTFHLFQSYVDSDGKEQLEEIKMDEIVCRFASLAWIGICRG